MEVNIPPRPISPGYPLQFSKIGKIAYPVQIWINHDSTNCKLSYIHGIGTMALLTKEELKQVVDRCLQECKGAVYINSISEAVILKIKELYPTYSYTQVPIGYNNSFQYHILIKNTVKVNANCHDPVPPPKTTMNKERLRAVLTTLLVKKRRKTDIVDEFIKMLD